ncbi:MAG: hypothetical protein CMD29_03855 [Flavobacteriales bacterium]|nr:hypothetical protein [Flavobacteriales bacterium]|tara:strand:+ start:2313 stop:3236 length:924 start_codon:yes stop_codon:yes gene_type:complete
MNKKAILSYPMSNNLGDYIQSIATKELIGKSLIEVDRENLHTYDGPKVSLIMNGWFMQNSKNWPPSNNIIPFFISFHINPVAKNNLLSKKGIEYFKKHEPIGCRDLYTQSILEKKGIKAYFSGCLTLTLKNKNKNFKREGILIIGALDRINPKVNFNNFFLELIKFPFKLAKYRKLKTRLDNFILKQSFSKVLYKNQIIDTNKYNEKERVFLANEQLNLIKKSRLVITSRIHIALPAVAYGTKVIFLNDGLQHINHQSRLKGISDYFYCCKSEDLNTLSLEDIKPKKDHKKIEGKLLQKMSHFLKPN